MRLSLEANRTRVGGVASRAADRHAGGHSSVGSQCIATQRGYGTQVKQGRYMRSRIPARRGSHLPP